MSKVQPTEKLVAIDRIRIPQRQRSLDPAYCAMIAATLPVTGLKYAIEVSAEGDGWRLVAGRHRLEAAKIAGWDTIRVQVVHLDERDIDASAALHEAFENLMRRELTALDRMAHLHAAKAAHDALYPEASKAGRRKTRTDDDNREIFSQLSFSSDVAERVGLGKRLVNMLTTAYGSLDMRARLRLQGSRLADKQSELLKLAGLAPMMQTRVLDLLLADEPDVASVDEAVAAINQLHRPDASERRVNRYAETIRAMPIEDVDQLFGQCEDAVRDYAVRRGWIDA